MNPIRHTRYKTESERRRGYPQDTGTRRSEYEAEKRSETRRSVYNDDGYLGYARLVETSLGTMHEALVRVGSYGHLSLGNYDTVDEAVDTITEWGEE